MKLANMAIFFGGAYKIFMCVCCCLCTGLLFRFSLPDESGEIFAIGYLPAVFFKYLFLKIWIHTWDVNAIFSLYSCTVNINNKQRHFRDQTKSRGC